LRGPFIGWFCLAAGFLVFGQPWPVQSQGSPPSQGKPALYEFGAGYCFSCKEMAKIMPELKAKYGDQLEVRMVYVDNDEKWMAFFHGARGAF
jgi:thiol-disulfide isomerase/thioredoxin